MSILIKGMEMPQSCNLCPFEFSGDCLLNRDIICTYEPVTRSSDCPLVPVPPHGRLIDADAMIHDIEKSFATSWYIKERNADMVKFLSLEDTIIPAEEAWQDARDGP